MSDWPDLYSEFGVISNAPVIHAANTLEVVRVLNFGVEECPVPLLGHLLVAVSQDHSLAILRHLFLIEGLQLLIKRLFFLLFDNGLCGWQVWSHTQLIDFSCN